MARRRPLGKVADKQLFGNDLVRVCEMNLAPGQRSMPRDTRDLKLAERLRDHPGDAEPLDSIGGAAGASRRTLEWLFRKEPGMSLGRWRRQARLLHAMRLLARGKGVAATALEVGDERTSAFTAAFSGALGMTPGRYYRSRETAD